MSARISGVKNFESKAASLVRGLPFSQVQSQSEKGAIFALLAATAVEGVIFNDCATGAAVAGGATGVLAFALVTTVVGCSAATWASSAASSCSMRFFMAASSLMISCSVSGIAAPACGLADATALDEASLAVC